MPGKAILGLLLAAAVLAVPAAAATTVWDFNGGLTASSGYAMLGYRNAATQAATVFGATDGTTVPNIGGESVGYMQFPRPDGLGGYVVDQPGETPFSTAYTLLWDILIPQSSFDDYSYFGFYNTHPLNMNDAELFVDLTETENGGRLFVDRDSDNGKVYTNPGDIQPGTWCRVALAYDRDDPAEDVRVFVNGVKVGASDNAFGDAFAEPGQRVSIVHRQQRRDRAGAGGRHGAGRSFDERRSHRRAGRREPGRLRVDRRSGSAPVVPVGSSGYAAAVAAMAPAVYCRLGEAAGREVGDTLVNEGSLAVTATWGLCRLRRHGARRRSQGTDIRKRKSAAWRWSASKTTTRAPRSPACSCRRLRPARPRKSHGSGSRKRELLAVVQLADDRSLRPDDHVESRFCEPF